MIHDGRTGGPGAKPPSIAGGAGAARPRFAGGFGGPQGPPILTKIFFLLFFLKNNYLLFSGKIVYLARFGPNNYLFFLFGGPPTNQW